jgi:hypothetical protein
MKRLLQAPNFGLAHLWASQLRAEGFDVSVQRQFAGGIAGEIPVDQSLPEIWIMDDSDFARARQVLADLQNLPHRRWTCPNCAAERPGAFWR